MTKLLLLELNELRFDYIEKYIDKGCLPNFKAFFEKHGYTKTVSETDQGILNPWVQWVTAHTGLEYEQHGVRRLSDMQGKDFEQIWEKVESMGHSVGALIPFNARNELKNAAFFLPDPWTRTKREAPTSVLWADDALKQITHDYASGKVKASSIAKILGSMALNMQWKHFPAYFKYGTNYLRGRKWHRALFCDVLFADLFLKMYDKTQPDFATVFVNAGAHLQHHYFFSSSEYDGGNHNPDWYVEPGQDPVQQAYELYDALLGELLEKFAGTRVMIATGLSQDPHDRISYYYRLEDHNDMLDRLGVPYSDIQPLMTEDFVLRFADADKAAEGKRILDGVHSRLDQDIFYVHTADDDVRDDATSPSAFYVDDRGDGSLYVQLRPSADRYPENFTLYSGDTEIGKFEKEVSFVSIKNGGHNGTGYFADTGIAKADLPESIPLSDIFRRVVAVFDPTQSIEQPDKAKQASTQAEAKPAAVSNAA